MDDIGDEAYITSDDRSGKLRFRKENLTFEVRFEGMGTGLGNEEIQSTLTKVANEVLAKLN